MSKSGTRRDVNFTRLLKRMTKRERELFFLRYVLAFDRHSVAYKKGRPVK